MEKVVTSPEAAYLTASNIVHPQSNRGSAGDPYVAADEVRARSDIQVRTGVTVSGGSIKKEGR